MTTLELVKEVGKHVVVRCRCGTMYSMAATRWKNRRPNSCGPCQRKKAKVHIPRKSP
jgi:hypothetical protein